MINNFFGLIQVLLIHSLWVVSFIIKFISHIIKKKVTYFLKQLLKHNTHYIISIEKKRKEKKNIMGYVITIYDSFNSF